MLPGDIKNPEVISQIRKVYGLESKEFSMVVTDYDLRPNVRRIFIITFIRTCESKVTRPALVISDREAVHFTNISISYY